MSVRSFRNNSTGAIHFILRLAVRQGNDLPQRQTLRGFDNRGRRDVSGRTVGVGDDQAEYPRDFDISEPAPPTSIEEKGIPVVNDSNVSDGYIFPIYRNACQSDRWDIKVKQPPVASVQKERFLPRLEPQARP